MIENYEAPPRQRIKGRASLTNETPRFELNTRENISDGWDLMDDDLPVLRTEVREERVRTAINRVKSPDLPFDRSLNPYRGCEHGCIYCFARPSHAYLNLSPGLDFETRLIARPNMAEVLEDELRARRYKVAPMAIGSNTDPYQPIEKEYEIMREILDVLARFDHPVAIVTKGSLIERDIDILAPMAAKGLVRVGISVTSLDRGLSRKLEPRVPAPARRLQTIQRLSEAGIPVRAMVSPMIPGLTDHELESILQACKDAGATAASWIMLRLPREVSPLFQAWLAEHYPAKVGKVMGKLRDMHGGKEYSADWNKRMRGEGPYADLLSARFRQACARLGISENAPDLRCDLFEAPLESGRQMALF